MEPKQKSKWGLFRPLLIIITILLLYLFAEAISFTVSGLNQQLMGADSIPPANLIFSFSGFGFSFILLLLFWGTVLLGEKVIFKESLLPTTYQPYKGMGRDILLGLTVGPVLFFLLFLAFSIMGWLSVTGTVFSGSFDANITEILWAIPVLLVMAVYEELMIRGFLLAVLKKYYGAPVGIAFSAFIFSLLHVYNPHLNQAGLIGILLAGAWLGLAYEVTNSLYLPTALHFSWNLSQSFLGFPVSGLDTPHLVETRIWGPPFWTGGEFGPEAGMAGYLLLIIGIAILIWYGKKPKAT
jgi:membrane protease YdiL (CAAX protease family)